MIASTLAICATLASAAPSLRRSQVTSSATATLQFEIAPDTFTSNTEITIGTVLDLDAKPIDVLSIGVISASDVTCQAFDQSTVVGTFSSAQNVFFPTLQTVNSITCDFTKRSPSAPSISAPAPATTPTVMGAVATAAEATLTLEIDADTFIQQDIEVNTQVDTDLELISATIATVKGAKNPNNVVCTATKDNSSNVAGVFTLAETAVFNQGKLVHITSISCVEKSK
jgi:hypothetical protein